MKKALSYDGFVKYFSIFVSVATVLIHVGNYTVFTLPSILFYAWHILAGFTLIYLYFPFLKNRALSPKARTLTHVFDFIILLGIWIVSAYVILNYESYVSDMQNNILTTEIFIFGIILTLITLEAARRTLGNILPIIAIIAIIYALYGDLIAGLFGHRGYSLERVILAIFSDRGIYGTPTGTCATTVYLFLLFAAFLNVSGADVIFQDIAIATAGRRRGGPAKMAVVASAMFGTISGSCVANVVSTGAFTIPLMRRNGYSARFAGAVESVSSTGGQIMPPIMGAAAFVLADIAAVPYSSVCIAAILPAAMYYICLFKMVDLEAVKLNLKGLPEDEIPELAQALARGLKLFVPIAVLLIALLAFDVTPMRSAIYAIVSVIVMGLLDSKDRMTIHHLLEAAIAAGKSLCTVLGACACAGIVVGIFSLTGLGLKFSNFIIQMGGSNLILSLVLSMLVCAILGMGLPTTAAYIVCATALSPALIELGITKLASHLFLLYFASLSAITPPVAVASYAAAGIAEENPLKVGFTSVKLGITGFLLPFAFALNSDYITIEPTFQTVLTWISGIVIAYALAIALQGYVEYKITLVERALYFVVIVLAITPYLLHSTIGILLFVLLYGWRTVTGKRLRKLERQQAELAA